MSAIKDLYDLGRDLEDKVFDRKTMDLIMPVLDKIKEVERQNLDLEKSQFELDRSHHDEMVKLQSIYSKEVTNLQSKISNLESEINHFKSKKSSLIMGKVERG